MLWEPAIYEHKAKLVGRSPADVSRSSELLAEALTREHEIYAADFMTVGIDVYNVEAEALGATVVDHSPEACPEIPQPPFSLDDHPAGRLEVFDPASTGRFPVLVEAADRFLSELRRRGDPAPVVRIAASGPVSIAAKLVGSEDLLIGAVTGEESALQVLQFACEVAERCSRYIRSRGLDVLVVDSFASPPMFSPDSYRDIVRPLHTRLMSVLAESGQKRRPLILGGNTTAIAGDLAATGATVLICDFAADAKAFGHGVAGHPELEVRRNVAPAVIMEATAGGPAALRDAVDRAVMDLGFLPNPILGTGILDYGQDPGPVVAFRDAAAGGG